MMVDKQITYKSSRGQELILVLYALWKLGARNSKQETIGFISGNGLFNVTSHDLPAYVGKSEPKYHTLLAWARKDGTIKEWIFDDDWNSWGITRHGRDVLDAAMRKLSNHDWDVRECYNWSPKFKKVIDPTYEPSERDRKHPKDAEEELDRLLGI